MAGTTAQARVAKLQHAKNPREFLEFAALI
jgi:hypothetical protein